MIRWDHILWRLKQLLVDPKRAIAGRFRRSGMYGDLEIWTEPSYFSDKPVPGLRTETRQPDGSWIVETYDEKGRKIIKKLPPEGA